MKLDKFLLFSGVFLAFVIACHAMQNVDKPKAYGTNIEAYYATAKTYLEATMKYDKLILFSSAFMGLVAFILYYVTGNIRSDSYIVKTQACSKARTCRKAANAYVSDTVAFQQQRDAVSTIEAYKQATGLSRHIAVVAEKIILFMEAIKASEREVQMYKLVAQLCKEANDFEKETAFFVLAVCVYDKLAAICAKLAGKYREDEDRIGEALAWLMSAYAHIESVNSCKDASGAGRKNAMYNRAAYTYTTAACCYINAASAYTNAGYKDGTIKAHQQAVAWFMTAIQMYQDAGDHVNEALNYYRIARLHSDLNEHAQAGAAFELAAHAYLQARNTAAAVAEFQEARMAYTTAWDPVALERVQSMIATLSL